MEKLLHYEKVYDSGIWTEEEFSPRKKAKLPLLLKKLRPQYPQLMLDLGCGNGKASKFFHSFGVTVIGVDISKKALILAKKQCSECDFVLATTDSLPFKREVFDLLFVFDIIEHLKNDVQCLEELVNLSKFEGIIFVSFPKENPLFKFPDDPRLGHIHSYNKNQIKQFFNEKGFSSDFCFVDAFFDYLIYNIDLLGKRLLTGKKPDALNSEIENPNLMVRLSRKIFSIIASIDLIYGKFPIGDTFFLFAKKLQRQKCRY